MKEDWRPTFSTNHSPLSLAFHLLLVANYLLITLGDRFLRTLSRLHSRLVFSATHLLAPSSPGEKSECCPGIPRHLIQILGTSFYCFISHTTLWILYIALSFTRIFTSFPSYVIGQASLSWGLLHAFHTWANRASWDSENSPVTCPRGIAAMLKPGATPQSVLFLPHYPAKEKKSQGESAPSYEPTEVPMAVEVALPLAYRLQEVKEVGIKPVTGSNGHWGSNLTPHNQSSVVHNRNTPHAL